MAKKLQRQDPAIERQELHCHACQRYVQFDIDLSLNGNHVLNCPNCGHEHCRVVENGKITDMRWDQRNQISVIRVSSTSTSSTVISTYDTTATTNGSSYFLYSSWMNTSAVS